MLLCAVCTKRIATQRQSALSAHFLEAKTLAFFYICPPVYFSVKKKELLFFQISFFSSYFFYMLFFDTFSLRSVIEKIEGLLMKR